MDRGICIQTCMRTVAYIHTCTHTFNQIDTHLSLSRSMCLLTHTHYKTPSEKPSQNLLQSTLSTTFFGPPLGAACCPKSPCARRTWVEVAVINDVPQHLTVLRFWFPVVGRSRISASMKPGYLEKPLLVYASQTGRQVGKNWR